MTNGELKFGRLNGFDFACLLVVLLCVLGFGLAKAGHAGVNQVITGTQKVDIDVIFVGLKTKDTELFKVGEKTSMTIRNVPVQPPMTIIAVKQQPKQVAFLSADGKKVVNFPDPTVPVAHDFEVTVTDTAERTNDGYVVRGQKVKVGSQIELEGFKYRVVGVVTDINPSKNQ
jgi:hypothetical protein